MKRFFTSVKQQGGFTLIELMVVVAIIGLLSAVAIPNFRKYQAKSKITEAKLQLSAIYTAESAFYSDYNMYAACLAYMGYDPSKEIASRYYATGFPAGVNTIATAAVTSATNSGMDAANCNVTNVPAADKEYFLAGKGTGATMISTQAIFIANPAAVGVACTNVSTTAGSCVGTQALTGSIAWQAAAVGVISPDGAAAGGTDASGLTINERKLIATRVQGY